MLSSRNPPEIPAPVDVLGLPLRPLEAETLMDLLVERGRRGMRTTVCYANAHTSNLAVRDPSFAELLHSADILFADGRSVVWASRWSDGRLPSRLTSADYFPAFAGRCARAGVSLYLLGGGRGIAEKAVRRLHELVGNVNIVGSHHGYFADSDSAAIVKEINACKPDVLVIGMSSPRQERWLAEHGDELSASVQWCVGALLDYLAGVERRAPGWLCRIGGEWLFRLCVDPVGKWRRYLLGNPLFVMNVIRWRLGRRKASCGSKAVAVRE